MYFCISLVNLPTLLKICKIRVLKFPMCCLIWICILKKRVGFRSNFTNPLIWQKEVYVILHCTYICNSFHKEHWYHVFKFCCWYIYCSIYNKVLLTNTEVQYAVHFAPRFLFYSSTNKYNHKDPIPCLSMPSAQGKQVYFRKSSQ